MKKVLFCAYNLDFGGIETSILNLLNNFDYDKYDVTLILERKEGVFLDRINKNVKIEEYRVCESKNVIYRKIRNFIKKRLWILKNHNKYDFSCCYATYSLPCNMLSRYASKNNLFYIHSNYTLIYDENGLRKFFDDRKINEFKHIAFVSNDAKDALIKYYPSIKDNSVVINNIINNKEIIKLSKEEVKENANKKLFVFVGRLEEKAKRISKMINVLKKFDNCELWIIGDGPDKKLYEDMVTNTSNIKLLGSRKNPYPYIKKADFIIFTSDYEGFPVVYNEAIVLGKKIVTTLDLSDDYISIKDRFGYIISKDENMMEKQINEILNNDNLKVENVNFDELNKERIKKIEALIEGENNEI